MTYDIRCDDLSSGEVRALIEEHLASMHQHSPPENVHALAVEALQRPEISFWTVWHGDTLCGCGALKALDERSGEVKSMRTRAAWVRRGVGQAMLAHILATARARGFATVHLETGTGPAFDAAHRLYLRNGFEFCGPFGDYRANSFSVFMQKSLDTTTAD